ncbi:MAG TPA: cytochrome c biogenesis protein CcdA [Chloroflexota bacterium]|nr:cytochrome c biogenesis protein CcdA [Chloroflexota bacterium]
MSIGNPLFWPLAFLAGTLSFTSPCCLPLLPGYLSYISGVGGEELAENRGRLTTASLLFVAGFALVFTALGASASALGSLLLSERSILLRLSGFFIIFMGLFTLGVFKIPALYMERRFHLNPAMGVWGALPLGMAFGFAWTPCVGPVLAAILTAASATGSVRAGAALLLVYALGLGLPFVVTSLFVERGLHAARWLQRHHRALNYTGGSVLIAMGVLLITDQWLQLLGPALRLYSRLNWPPV